MGRRSKAIGTLQPKGKPLYQETSSFGSRMLSKMGWEAGRGLGVQLQGNPEFVRIKYKSDADGLGYEDRNDQWTKNEDGFSQLLNSLNQSNPASDPVKPKESLEEKSKNSRARVHYMKFTKGKDLSKRTPKELANIFGKSSLVDEAKTETKSEQESSDGNVALIYETNTIKASISSKDYFKNKLQSRNIKLLSSNNDSLTDQKTSFKQDSDNYPEENVSRACFKMDYEDNERETNTTSNEEVTNREKKSKKKRKIVEPDVLEIVETISKEKKTKKRKLETVASEPLAELELIPTPELAKTKKKNLSKSPDPSDDQHVVSKTQNGYSNAAYASDDVEQTVISVDRFAVDKLNFLDLEILWHSNVANVIGYGLTENLNINLLNCQTLQNSKCNKYELYYLMDRKMSQRKINFKMKAKRAVFVPI